MNEREIIDAARIWLRAFRTDAQMLSDDEISELEAIAKVLVEGPEENFWSFVDEVANGADTDLQIANFGCGPLETFLVVRSPSFSSVADRVARGGRYVDMLELVDVDEIKNHAIKSLVQQLKSKRLR
jgi:hypothetical protein